MMYRWSTTILAIGLLLTAACNNDQATVAVAQPAATVLGAAIVSPQVAIIAIGDTLQLPVSAQSLTGDAIPASEIDSVRYVLNTAGDSVYLPINRVTGTAVGTKVTVGPNHVRVNVFVFKGSTARGTQALVQVTAARVAGPLTMSVQPLAPATSTLVWGTTQSVYPRIYNAVTGDSVRQPAVWYAVRDTDVARIGVYAPSLRLPVSINPAGLQLTPSQYPAIAPNAVAAYAGEGSGWVYARVSAYGQLLQDSARYSFIYPAALTITTAKTAFAVTATFFQDQVFTLAPGAVVSFTNGVSDAMRVTYTFDTPAAATAVGGGGAGNTDALTAGATAQRQFAQAGTYKWTATASYPGTPWDGQSVSGTLVIK